MPTTEDMIRRAYVWAVGMGSTDIPMSMHDWLADSSVFRMEIRDVAMEPEPPIGCIVLGTTSAGSGGDS